MIVRTLLIVGAVVALIVAPFLISAVIDNARSNQLVAHLASANLPSRARVIGKTGRVFNGGNGNACDYQCLVIVSYWGEASALRQAFLTSLQEYAERFPNAQIISGAPDNDAEWWAKIWGESTELSIRPNIDRSPLYLVSLTYSARDWNFDLRCA